MQMLTGKVLLVTGAARGLGEVIARLAVRGGADVVLADVSDGTGEVVAKELGERAAYFHLDVRKERDWADAVAFTQRHFGHLDVLVNDAAILRAGPLETFTVEDFMAQVEVNQLGPFLGIKAVVPAMRSAGGGSIVNIGSVDAIHGMGGVLAYAGTKWAIRGMTKSAAQELGPENIRVNSVHPGGMHTHMTDDVVVPGIELGPDQIRKRWAINRFARIEEIASVVLFLASDDSSYCTGADFAVDGGSTVGPRYVV
jgi:3alpha(or 20beta)-hydroxysteroid dehydrogenase